MPLPRRSYGRPGTPIIPADWETSHAVPAGKFRTADCTIYGLSTGEPVYDPALGYSVVPEPPVLYTGTARVQVLSAQESSARMGGQNLQAATYLVAIDYAAGEIPLGALVAFTNITDPTLATGRRLTVAKIDRGSLRWERDLYCIDDMSQIVEEVTP